MASMLSSPPESNATGRGAIEEFLGRSGAHGELCWALAFITGHRLRGEAAAKDCSVRAFMVPGGHRRELGTLGRPPRRRSIRGEGDVVAADLAQGVAGGHCSASFLIAAPGGLIPVAADLGRNLEALAVVGPFFVEQLIGGGAAELALGELLQLRFVVAAVFARGRHLDFRSQMGLDKEAGRGIATIEINRGDQRLEDVGQKGRRHGRVASHPLAQDQEFVEAQGLADFAQVCRLTTTDLILVSSPSSKSG